jgi:hypothetical protein
MGAFHLPSHTEKTYPAANVCIYCGATDNLSDEHIIPFGLGGRWVLPKASCANCAGKTSAFEQTCQRTMFGPLRMYYDLPTRRPKERPKTIPLKVKVSADADWSFIDVDQDIYPFLILFPCLPMPDELSGYTTLGERGAAARQLWIRGASFRDGIQIHVEALAAELKVVAIEPSGTFRGAEFFRMLAKIAHAFALAEGGKASFSPFLTPIISGADVSNCAQYIGGLLYTEPAVPPLHELSVGSHTCNRPEVVTVRIRLLAALETPTYYVAVGRRH